VLVGGGPPLCACVGPCWDCDLWPIFVACKRGGTTTPVRVCTCPMPSSRQGRCRIGSPACPRRKLVFICHDCPSGAVRACDSCPRTASGLILPQTAKRGLRVRESNGLLASCSTAVCVMLLAQTNSTVVVLVTPSAAVDSIGWTEMAWCSSPKKTFWLRFVDLRDLMMT